MGTRDLTRIILSKYDGMTKAEKKVADYVMSNPSASLSLTITDLARRCGVGDTSVFRFCRTLNFNGYQEFRISLALSTNDGKTALPSATVVNPSQLSSEEEAAVDIMNCYNYAVKKTFESLDYDALRTAINLIVNAEFIYFFGAGGSALSAAEAHLKFSKIMANVGFDSDLHQQLTKASLMRPSYLAIVYSNSGLTKDAIQIAKMAHDRGASVIFITEFLNTPASEFADVVLHSGASEGPFEGGSVTAKTSQLFMMDILYSGVYRKLGNKAGEAKKISAEAIVNQML